MLDPMSNTPLDTGPNLTVCMFDTDNDTITVARELNAFGPNGLAGPAALAWRVFSVTLIFTAVGSAVYHWAPSNASLVGDRLPIAWICAALLCAFMAERVDPRWGHGPALLASLLCASAAVAYWWLTDRSSTGDLRPYLYVQFLPMLLIPAALCLRLEPRFVGTTPASAWWVVLAAYAAAKAFELADRPVFEAVGLISGHTLKHLLAAAGAAWLLHAATRPRPASVSSGSQLP